MEHIHAGTAGRTIQDDALSNCIQHCLNCYQACTEAISYCLALGGPHAESRHVTNLINCARICQVSADFMLSGSELHRHTCRACAEVCAQCAKDCERFSDDSEMQRCARACKDCAASCNDMAGH